VGEDRRKLGFRTSRCRAEQKRSGTAETRAPQLPREGYHHDKVRFPYLLLEGTSRRGRRPKEKKRTQAEARVSRLSPLGRRRQKLGFRLLLSRGKKSARNRSKKVLKISSSRRKEAPYLLTEGRRNGNVFRSRGFVRILLCSSIFFFI
jgi:hypothetical protein